MTVKLKNEVYNVLKWFTVTAIPSLVLFVSTVGHIYNWTYTESTTALIGAVGVLFAGLLGLSSYNYNKENNKE